MIYSFSSVENVSSNKIHFSFVDVLFAHTTGELIIGSGPFTQNIFFFIHFSQKFHLFTAGRFVDFVFGRLRILQVSHSSWMQFYSTE